MLESCQHLQSDKSSLVPTLPAPVGRVLNAPVGSKHVSARLLADSHEMFEVLLQSTKILKLEFTGLEGGGRETLVKCENALCKTRSVCTIELPLYYAASPLRVPTSMVPRRR